jgi:RsiW-degrading membrane proteinase PrsW (M82 family)
VTAARTRLGWLLALACGAAFVHAVVGTPAAIVLAAVAPALGYTGLLLLLDRHEREPLGLVLGMLLWGAAVAAPLASALNDLLLSWTTARALVPILGAPLVEEAAKALGLLVLLALVPHEIDDTLDGLVYGAVIGVGFAMTENLTYFTLAAVQGGTDGLIQSLYLRGGLAGFNHAVFTAAIGAGVGYCRDAPSPRAGRLGLGAGIVLGLGHHAVWNAVAAPALARDLCGAELPGGPCAATPPPWGLYVVAPFVVALFLGPGGLVLLGIALLVLGREARLIARELSADVAAGDLTREEYARLASVRARLAAEWQALLGGGWSAWRQMRRRHRAAIELAFARHRLRARRG